MATRKIFTEQLEPTFYGNVLQSDRPSLPNLGEIKFIFQSTLFYFPKEPSVDPLNILCQMRAVAQTTVTGGAIFDF